MLKWKCTHLANEFFNDFNITTQFANFALLNI